MFDPARIEARPSVETPATLPTGMDYVLVNGAPVIDRGRLDPAALPGKPVRRTKVQ